jgi:hypothetical protein
MGQPATTVEIAAQSSDFAARIAAVLSRPAVEHNIYRRQVVSFTHDMFGERAAALSFQPRPTMAAELILPEATTSAITRQVVGVARHLRRLLDAGQHLNRGLLLDGPPGVGKDPHGAIPDEPAHQDDHRAARGQHPAPDRACLLGGAHPPALPVHGEVNTSLRDGSKQVRARYGGSRTAGWRILDGPHVSHGRCLHDVESAVREELAHGEHGRVGHVHFFSNAVLPALHARVSP